MTQVSHNRQLPSTDNSCLWLENGCSWELPCSCHSDRVNDSTWLCTGSLRVALLNWVDVNGSVLIWLRLKHVASTAASALGCPSRGRRDRPSALSWCGILLHWISYWSGPNAANVPTCQGRNAVDRTEDGHQRLVICDQHRRLGQGLLSVAECKLRLLGYWWEITAPIP